MGSGGKIHASIIQDQGQQITAMGDDVAAAASAAKVELDLATVETFNRPEDMYNRLAMKSTQLLLGLARNIASVL